MLRKARSFLAVIVGLVVGVLAVHLGAGPAYATEEKVSSIQGKEIGSFIVRVKEEGLLPKQATVKPGTTVIWLNMQSKYIEIEFTGDQKVDVACKAPVHFVLGVDMSYISDKVPFGAVASLCFIEKGTYKYTLRSAASIAGAGERPSGEETGQIIVQD
jgi:plastocyanin